MIFNISISSPYSIRFLSLLTHLLEDLSASTGRHLCFDQRTECHCWPVRRGDPEPPDRLSYIYTPEKKPAYPSKTLFILHVFLNDSKASRFKSVPMPEKVQAFQPYVFDSWRCTRRDVAVNVPTTGHAREHFLEQVACCTHPGKQPLARSTI